MTAPAWINPDQRFALNPPAEVYKLGELPRAPDKLLAIAAALHFPDADRYRPGTGGGRTWCNLATIDFMAIARRPIPRMARGAYLRANDLADMLEAGQISGWRATGTIASAPAVIALANAGIPQIAVWKNPTPELDSDGQPIYDAQGKPVLQAGHVMPVVPGPALKVALPAQLSGVFVSGAGAICVHKVPIERCFGRHTSEVKFYASDE